MLEEIDIIKSDRVIFIKGKYKGYKGYVTRTDDNNACVVIKNVWDHGIWFDKNDLKRTKRYVSEQELV